MMDNATRVELTWIKDRIENHICFGHVVDETVVDATRRIVSFAPASIFAFVRWASDQYGTDVSRIDILRAVRPGQSYSTVPYVRPGGEVLLRLVGRSKVESALKAIDAVRKLGIDPADSEPEYWRMVHNRLVVKPPDRFHTYTHSQHYAWLRRRNASL
jgi:hypothetical protein